MSVTGDALNVAFGSRAASLSASGLRGAVAEATIHAPHLALTAPDDTLRLEGFSLKASAPKATTSADIAKTPVDIALSAKKCTLRQDTLSADVGGLLLTASALPASLSDGCLKGRARLKAASAALRAGLHSASLTAVTADVASARATHKQKAAPLPAHADAALLADISHSPEYLTADLPQAVRDLFAHWNLSGSVQARKAVVLTPAYPVRNVVSDLDIAFTPDELAVRSLRLSSQSNRLSMQARIAGLRRLLTIPGPQPIRLDLDLALDTIDINSVAGAFEAGVRLMTGKEYYTPQSHASVKLTAADSVTMLVPRNIEARIRATAKETVYTNLHLYDLAALLSVDNGRARLTDLSVASDFGHAGMTLDYDTRDAADMDLTTDIHLDSIDVVSFFRNFHTLLLMMPQMSNLSGYVSAEASAGFDIFPDMFVNVPSMQADVNVQGRSLKVHQDDFIRHITRMLLIREDGDLDIADMDVHASVHDNLLELYPFDFSTAGYELSMLGLNNFNGDLYYHIGVERSPLHFPFGINIVGHFHHPEFRFGGAHYKPEKAWPITNSISGFFDINMLKELKYYTKEFVHKAAESSTAPASDFVFGPSRATNTHASL